MYLPDNIHDLPHLRNLTYCFKDRWEAGRILAEMLAKAGVKVDYVLAIPAGGVPIGIEIARKLNIKLDFIICRKILVPWNKEAGFGWVTPDGEYWIDPLFIAYSGITSKQIKEAILEAQEKIRRRENLLRQGRGYEHIKGRRVIVVDDGIAAGYTMTAAITFLKKLNCKPIIIAIPTAYYEALMRLYDQVDEIYVCNIRAGTFFAVAEAYVYWYDIDDNELLRMIEVARKEKLLAP